MLDQNTIKGEKARLFPILADTSREGRVLSITLASLSAVFDFRRVLLKSVGQQVGVRTTLDAYSEVSFPQEGTMKDRPDGLIVLRTGKRTWSALIEAKIGNAEIDPSQIERYLKLAKRNNINAVISISNQFASQPDQPTYSASKIGAKGIELYHWSWMHIRTEAALLCDDGKVEDPDQVYILSELVRYLSHDAVGISGFDQMNSEWPDLVGLLQKGGRVNKTAPETQNTVSSWHQELRDLSLILRRRTLSNVSLRLPRAQEQDAKVRLKADAEHLSEVGCLTACFDIPDTAAFLDVNVSLVTRAIHVGMKLKAPSDRKSGKARVNWLLRQVKDVDSTRIVVRAHWAGRTPHTQASLEAVRENPDVVLLDDPSKAPVSLEILMATEDGRRFRGRKTFIQMLEEAVPEFYDRIGQNLKAWEPPAPRIRNEVAPRDIEDVDLVDRQTDDEDDEN